jgi:predicted AAA+ superfamily ATPase
MTKSKNISRDALGKVRDLGTQFRVVVITGPRQAGKTTLAREAFPEHAYVSLEDPDVRLLAEGDPRAFLSRHPGGLILDEVQRVPSLLSYLQTEVDAARRPGRFVLTGSSNLLMHAQVSQSLAGRACFVDLPTLSLAEASSAGLKPASPEEAVWRGGYPEVVAEGLDPVAWYNAYLASYVERDVRQLVQVRDLAAFQRFLRLCAVRVGQLWNRAAVGADAGVSAATVDAWASVLEASHVVWFLRPYHRNFGKRLTKSPKLYFHDPALAARLLGLSTPGQVRDNPLWGALFENLVASEIRKAYANRAQTPPMWFWRDQRGSVEVDLVTEEGGFARPTEIKAGQTVAGDWFAGLEVWRAWAGRSAGSASLVYGGGTAASWKSWCRIVPWDRAGVVGDGEIRLS